MGRKRPGAKEAAASSERLKEEKRSTETRQANIKPIFDRTCGSLAEETSKVWRPFMLELGSRVCQLPRELRDKIYAELTRVNVPYYERYVGHWSLSRSMFDIPRCWDEDDGCCRQIMRELAETYYRDTCFIFECWNMFRLPSILAYSESMGGVRMSDLDQARRACRIIRLH